MGVQREARAKQKQEEVLDTSLLCSKLEEIKREQDAHRFRREKRDAVRNGFYVPRSAAKQSEATATPAMADHRPPTTRKHFAKHLQPIHEPMTSDECICISPERLHRVSYITAEEESHVVLPEHSKGDHEQEKRDSMNPLSSDTTPPDDSVCRMTPNSRPIAVVMPERRSSSAHLGTSSDSIERIPEEEDQAPEERGRSRQPRPVNPTPGQYQPGDAAKRRSMVEIFPNGRSAVPIPDDLTIEPPHRPTSFYAIQDLRQARSILDNEVHTDLEGLSEDEPDSTQPRRPQLQTHKRPDWTQQSQTGTEMRHTLHVFPSRRPATEGGEKDRRPKSTLAPIAPARSRTPQGNPTGDHMIADAVKIIQRQEKLKRRQSVIGFFKRL